MASHTVPAVSRSGWTPEARTGSAFSARVPLCVNPTVSAWTGGCHAGSGGQSERLATELAGRNCCRPVHFSVQCPLSNSIPACNGPSPPDHLPGSLSSVTTASFHLNTSCHSSVFYFSIGAQAVRFPN